MNNLIILDFKNPVIYIRFSEGNIWYKYTGFELGECLRLKKKYKLTPYKLANHLKNLSYVIIEKVILNVGY